MTKSEKINLWATILGPIVVVGVLSWMNWSWNAKMDLNRAADAKFNADTYESRNDYKSDLNATNQRLDSIGRDLSTVQQDVASIKGQLSGRSGRHGAEELTK